MKKFLSVTLAAAAALTLSITASAMTADSLAGTVSTESGRLNVRSAPSAEASVITSVKKGSYATLVSKTGEWWRVEYQDGKFGYCHEDYISVISENIATVSTRESNLNVRSGAGKSYPVTDTLAKGEKVLVLSSNGYWSRILYDGNKTGCVSSDYLSFEQKVYKTISLGVPDFKQTDPRWSNVKIGSSGKTIGKIGCVTTGIAMMETYRSGKTVYPDAMAKKLTYDSRGNVYWPSDLTVNYWSENYLETVYRKLLEGKPVLIGAKNSSGSQHWVVVTGFTGGENLSASKFTINDPGYEAHITLNQFFAKFPTLYKFFYYN